MNESQAIDAFAGPPTIRDVARAAGVSKSLVSLVLRGDPGVSAQRRRAVEQAVAELGYETNRTARALAGNGTGAIGVLINDFRNPWFVDLVDGLTAALGPTGIAPLIVDSATNQRVGRSSVQILTRQNVDGIVAVGISGEENDLGAAARRLPVVLAGTYDPNDIGADVATNDDEAGARQATEHLIGLGHRHIVHLRGDGSVGDLRELGYRAAMAASGLTEHIRVRPGGMSIASGREATELLLADSIAPTGYVAYNDLVAIGVLAAADAAGLTSPADLSVVGYDDTFIAGIDRLALTSVQNGTYEIGEHAARFLIERIAGFVGPPRVYRVPSTLIIRHTTGPAPAPVVVE